MSTPSTSSEKPSVAVVEDDADLRESLKDILEAAGYTPVVYARAQDLLGRLAIEQPDIVISDIIMEDMDGLEVVRHIKRDAPGARIIAISGGTQSYLDWASKLGADAVLRKPFRRDALLAAIANLTKDG